MSDDERVTAIMTDIQNHVGVRRLRMKEFFYDFDHLRCGRCTRNQFVRALNTAGLKVSDEDALMLADHFTVTGPNVIQPQVISYDAFVKVVEEVFVNGTEPEMSCSPSSTMLSTFVPNNFEDETILMHVLHRLATMCKTRGIVLKYCFSDFANAPIPSPSRPNPRMGGKCTVNQFIRNFPFKKEFGENDLNVLIERYKTKKGDFHFGALHNEVSEAMSHEPQPFPQSPLVMRQDSTVWAHDDLDPVHKIQSKVCERRIRMYENFQDFDPLRKGFCTLGQLKCVFTCLNLAKEINKNEFDRLAYTYMRDDGMFCYADFCRDVDLAFAKPNLEKEPLTVCSMPDVTSTAPARRNKIRLSTSERAKIAELEDRLRSRVWLQRVLIKPTFQDMDKPNRGFITKNQFARCMQMLGFKISEMEVAMLAGVYCNLGNHLDFNYLDFCKSVDPPAPDLETAEQQAQAPFEDYQPSRYFDPFGKISKHDSISCF
jgi:Ca2+-binding EF-hand superfamily protein